MLDFRIPEYDKAKRGRQLVTLEWCFGGANHTLGYIQVTPMTNGDLELARKIAALPNLIAVCEEIAKEPYPGSDAESLLETLRERARAALRGASGGSTMKPINPHDPTTWPDIPASVAVCPFCGAAVVIEEIDEHDDDGQVTDTGLHINCSTEPSIDSDEWDDWHNSHWSMPYVDWLPVQATVHRWLDARYRVDTVDWNERLRTWNEAVGEYGKDKRTRSRLRR